MANVVQALRVDISRLEEQLKRKQHELACAVRNCPHDWTPIEAAHIYHKGYTIEGDPPGTMGVDWRGPFYVEPKTEKRWKRTCRRCGEVEYTTKIKQEMTEHPTFD